MEKDENWIELEDAEERQAVLESGDGQRVTVRTMQLCLQSRFFTQLFYGELGRSRDNVYKLPLISYRVLTECLEMLTRVRDHLIPSDTSLSHSCELLEAATYLSLPVLEAALINIISTRVDPLNIVQVFRFAEMRCVVLAKRLWDMITADFDMLFLNRTYRGLTEAEIIQLLNDEKLGIEPVNEEKMVDGWMEERDEMEKMELSEYSQKLQRLNLFSKDGYCIYKKRYPRKILLAIGGWSTEGVTNATEWYGTRTNQWTSVHPKSLTDPLSYHGLVNRPEGMYVLGGFNGRNYFNQMKRFSFADMQWTSECEMRCPRSYVSATSIDDKIIALGGFNGIERLSTVEIYNVQKKYWATLPDMRCSRSDGSACTINERVYAIGGFDGTNIHDSVEFFDFEKHAWIMANRRMHSLRTGVSAITIDRSCIAVVGGFNGTKRLKSFEMYDVREGLWHAGKEMITTRSNFSMGILDGQIFACGGYDGTKTTTAVESYDFRANRWSAQCPLVISKSALRVTYLDNFDVIRAFVVPC